LTGWLLGLLAAWLAAWLAGWLVRLLACWLTGWLAGSLVTWLARWLVRVRLVGPAIAARTGLKLKGEVVGCFWKRPGCAKLRDVRSSMVGAGASGCLELARVGCPAVEARLGRLPD